MPKPEPQLLACSANSQRHKQQAGFNTLAHTTHNNHSSLSTMAMHSWYDGTGYVRDMPVFPKGQGVEEWFNAAQPSQPNSQHEKPGTWRQAHLSKQPQQRGYLCPHPLQHKGTLACQEHLGELLSSMASQQGLCRTSAMNTWCRCCCVSH